MFSPTDKKQQQKMETTDHLFESIHSVYSNKSHQNTNILATTVGNPNTVKYLFGLPRSNTEYCQIPPNTIWELALRDHKGEGRGKWEKSTSTLLTFKRTHSKTWESLLITYM